MTIGHRKEQLEKFKIAAKDNLERGEFAIHKWESDIKELVSERLKNPSKILGHRWDKENDSIDIQIPKQTDEIITKRSIISMLGRIYDPLGLMSLTLAGRKHIYREACEESSQ